MNRKNVEDLYTLTPLQQGMLFHALHSPGADAYAEQIVISLEGEVRPDAFARAWQAVVDRTPALRTGFVWEKVPQPVQVVFRQAALPVRVEDWGALPADEAEARWAVLVDEDRAAGWEPRRAPLVRLALARVGAREWRFLFSMHHLVMDGWSLALLMADFHEAYEAERQGRAAVLPRRPAFRDYVAWVAKRDAGAAEAYWRARLAGVDEPTPLPLDRAPERAGRHAEEHGQETVPISAETARALADAARRHRVTLGTMAQAAWAAVLARHTGRGDVVFGATVSGRSPGVPGVEEMVGLFINTVPVRVRVPASGSTAEWLRSLQAEEAEARDHELSPLPQVRSWSALPGDAPFFETLFVFENYPVGAGGDDDGEDPFVVTGGRAAERTNYAFSLVVAPSAEGMRATATYDARRLDPERARALLAAYATVLQRLAAGEDDLAAALDPVGDEERRRVVEEWNRTAAPYPHHPVHRVFESLAAADPEAVALRWDGGTLGYGELNARANRLARRLRALGVRPEDRVGVSLERSPEVIVVLLAILKAGGAYVPLDPSYPPARLEHMRRDADVRIVVTAGAGDASDGAAWAGDARIVALEDEREVLEAEPADDLLDVEIDAEGLAYVLYTSGSTGLPKGAAVPHRAVVRLVRGQEFARFGADEVVLQTAPVAFDASTFEIWGPLLNGGSLAIHPPDAPEPRALGEFATRHGVTTAWLTAGLFHRAVDEGLPGFAGVRQLLAGGDVLSPPHVARAMEILPGARLVNGYGPTEATTFSASHTVRADDLDGRAIPIGRPLANARCHVLDAGMRPVPVGAPGELYVGGDGLARGYLGQAGMTAEKFVPDPFAADGGRLYRTGDRVRWTERGEIEFLGRIDQQVKVRGFRIEPGEIEAVLRAHPSVRDAVVMTRGEGEMRRLVAYVTPAAIDVAALRAHAADRLPDHMVPSAIVALDAFPLTPNGKVDRRALPEPGFAAADGRSALATPTEELLAGVWREVLGVEGVGPADDFFLLGGHSLLAMKVVSRARALFAAELPVREVFEATTLRAMAARIDAHRAGAAAAPPPPIGPAPRDVPPILSYGQERLWLMETLAPGALAYGISIPIPFPADADADLLARALAEVVRRHEALRTVFRASDAGPAQVVEPPFSIHLPVEDLRGEADPARAMTDAAARASSEGFDLERGPLIRARLLRLRGESVLLATIHHIVFDGWSIGVLEREMRALYDAFSRGEPSPLAPLAAQYADYAAWQRRWLETGVLDAQVEFWRRALAGAPAAMDLAADRPRPAARTHAGARRFFHLPAELVADARALAQREGATLFMVLLAAFDVLLARLSGSDDVVVGTQVAGRTREETEGLIGLFVNGLALRTDLSGDPPFREAVARVRRATLDAYAHQDVPFQRLVEALGVERTLSHPPVFNVSFVLQSDGSAPAASTLDLPDDDGGGLPEGPFPVGAEYELLFELRETEGAIVGGAVYSTEIFEHDTAARLVSEYGRLLAALVAAPDAPVSSPAPADAAETERVLGFSTGPAPGDVSIPVHRRFEAWAARAPESVALRLDEGTVTYARLNARANRVAHHLRAAGIGPESRVGVSLERSAELVAVLLGVLKAGGGYVPLDPAYPADRLRFMAADTGVDAVVTDDPALVAPWCGGARIVSLAEEGEAIAARPDHDLEVEVDPEGLAYVLYTSGSTGQPKGVAVGHRAVVGVVTGQEYAAFGPGEVFLQVAPVAFDASTLELWGALLNGGAVAVHPAGVPDPERLGEFLARHGVTAAWLTAGFFHQVVDAGAPGFGGLRGLLSGGDVLSPAHVARARVLLPETRLVNGYGPTETTVFACCHVVSGDEAGALPVGRPIRGARVYLLDAAMRPVPVGVPGEVYVGGTGVGRGFVARAGATAERFVPDPFSDGGRVYRTGDLARWNRRGEVEFLGRLDRQAKVRGFRVEPGEIEAALRAHPAVADAVVDVLGEGEARRLAAWVVPIDGASPSVDALRAHAAERLPPHLVPSAFAVIGALPLTPNGKVDRRALPAPDLGSADGFVAPAGPTEEIVAGSWADLLEVERVGARDDFFHLGGHSLLATRAVSRLRAAFGVDVPLRALFEHPTVAGLAAEVDRLRGAAPAGAPGEIDAPVVPDGGEAPVSFAQERMWFLDRLEPGTASLAIPYALRLRGPLDAAALKRALEEVVRRHQALRTVFPERGGVPVQRVLPAGPIDLPLHDLRGMNDGERGEAAAAIARRVAEAPFDLEHGPLLRVELARLGDEEHAAFTCVHHAVSDGWSLSLFLSEWTTLYAAFARGEPSPLPEPALQYPGFAAWQREWLRGEALEAQLDYWRRTLAGAPPRLELPTDRPRPPVQGHVGAVETVAFPRELSDAVLALGRREGATLFMVMLAALDVVFARWSGQDDVVVGTPIAGRTRRETEGVMGLFLNTLALRVDLSGDPGFAALLARVRDVALGAYAHQDVPFEAVLAEVKPERDLSRSPVFQVMLNLTNFEGARTDVPGLAVEPYGHADDPASKFDLTLYAGDGPEGIVANLVYDAALFGAGRMRALLAQLQAVLAQAVEDPSRPLSAFSLSTGDAATLLPDPSLPIEPEAWSGAVHEAFAARAAATPDAVAIVDSGEEWTYAELDAAANRIAHRLIDCGVRPGHVVAVHGHRSAPLVRALLGTWKAGAAFAVLDPAYPPARLAAQVRAAKPLVILLVTAAGDVPGELIEALGESVKGAIVLGPKSDNPDGIARFPATPPAVAAGADDLAYVAFTSGTTGQPKAIAGTHRPLAHFFGWYAREFGLGAEDRFPLLSGLAHDPLLRDVFAPLTVGGSIAIPDGGEIGTPGWLAEWMRGSGITVAHLTPAMGQLLSSSGDAHLPSLRLALFGGDVLRAGDVDRLRAIAPAVQIVNVYGATETPQAIAAFRVPSEPSDFGAAIPIGRGIDGVDLLVLAPDGRLAGIGELGEIAVRTPYLSRSYLNDAELTAARFVANPATGDEADRIYRTGDLGRYRPDGAVEVAGRADAQVKVRGFRIETGEIEGALARHDSVREAVVVARGEDDDRSLAAYIVPSDGAEVDAAALRAHLRTLLPEPMVPAAFVAIAAVPLTANGKVDRRALPDPAAAVETAEDAPLTATEESVAAIWREVLETERVRAEDDFFALGGHSLRVTQVLSRIRAAMGVTLSVRAFFAAPTVRGLAAAVDAVRPEDRAAVAVEPAKTEAAYPPGVYPLSPAQQSLWARMQRGGSTRNLSDGLRFTGPLDDWSLEHALTEVVRRHEPLRTKLEVRDGEPVQVVQPARPVRLRARDVDADDPSQRDAAYARAAEEEALAAFPAEGPFFRARLLRAADDDHVLLWTAHPVMFDEGSREIFRRELLALYRAFAAGEASPLPDLPASYGSHALRRREEMGGGAIDRLSAWWTERMAGAPALLPLPTDRPRPAEPSGEVAVHELRLAAGKRAAVETFARERGATPFMVLLAAFQAVLGRWAGTEDVVVGTPVPSRAEAEAEPLVGPFAGTLALRGDLSGDPSFAALVERTREMTIAAYDHQDLPFETLVDALHPERPAAHAPVVQAMLILRDAPAADLPRSIGEVEVSEIPRGRKTSAYDLVLTIEDADDAFAGTVEYAAELFDPATIGRITAQLGAFLAAALDAPEIPLSAMPVSD